MASTKTLYFLNALAGTSSHMALQDGGSAPSSGRSTTGWKIGTQVASKSAVLGALQTAPTGSFIAVLSANPPVPLQSRDAFRSENAYYGRFGPENWNLSLLMGTSSVNSGQRGYPRWRLWVGSATDGSNAIQISTSVMCGTQVAPIAVGTGILSDLTFTPGAFTCTSQYLFFQLAWATASAGGNVNRDALISVGNSSSIITSQFGAFRDDQILETPEWQDRTLGTLSTIRQFFDQSPFAEQLYNATAFNRDLLESSIFQDLFDSSVSIPPSDISRVVLDASIFLDSSSQALSAIRAIVDSILSSSDRLDRALLIQGMIADSFHLLDALERLTLYQRMESSSTLLTELSSRTSEALRSVLNEVGIAEVIDQIASIKRSFFENVLFADSMLSQISAITEYVRQLFESAGIFDSTIRLVELKKTLVETFFLADDSTRKVRVIREALDATGITQSQVSTSELKRFIAETAGLTERTDRVLALVRSVLDQAGLADKISYQTYLATIERILTDTMPINEKFERTSAIVRSALEAASLTDAITQSAYFRRALADVLLGSDRTDLFVALHRQVSEAAPYLDTFDREFLALRQTAESLFESDRWDSTISTEQLSKLILDLLSVADWVDRQALSHRQYGGIQTSDMSDTFLVTIFSPSQSVFTGFFPVIMRNMNKYETVVSIIPNRTGAKCGCFFSPSIGMRVME